MKPFYFLPFLPVFPYTRFFIRVFFCRSERREKRKFRRFFSFELNVRFPLQFGSYIFTPPRHDSGSAWSRTRKGLTKIVKPFSYAAFCSRRLISFVLGVRNDVAFRCTTLTAEGHGRTNPFASATKIALARALLFRQKRFPAFVPPTTLLPNSLLHAPFCVQLEKQT